MHFPYPVNDVPTTLPLVPAIKKRWSPVCFSGEPIEQEKIDTLFEAMRWSQSSFNEQPWRVVYATKDHPEDFERLASLLNEGNAWAKNAYMLFFIACSPNFARNNKLNRNAEYDTGAAINNLFLQAVEMNLIAHEMAGFDAEKGMEILKFPGEWKPLAMMAVGYPEDPAKFPKEMQDRQKTPRNRKEISEVAHIGMWQQ